MARKAHRSTPSVIGGVLYTDNEYDTGMRIADPAWHGWCLDNSSFYYDSQTCPFSVRKEKLRNGYFWYAYKRAGGKLLKRYLGVFPGRDQLDQMAERLRLEVAQR